MNHLLHINLIRFFTFYLTAMFLVGTLRRIAQYRDMANLALSLPKRWPLVLGQMRKHRGIFASWDLFRPMIVAFALMLIQMICSRLIWPRARISFDDLLGEWWTLPILLIAAVGMIGVDVYFVVRVGRIDRAETEKYLDQAEHWMKSWKAHAVRIFTFGWVDPRRMVDTEVQKAMTVGSGLISWALWWVSVQTGLRLLFGLCLWTSWAILPGGSAPEVSVEGG